MNRIHRRVDKKVFGYPLIYIFVFSLFLHWYHIDIASIDGPDEPRDYERAVRVSNGEFFPVHGIEINYIKKKVGTPGGFVYLLMSIPHLFSDYPYASIIFLGLLASLTVIVVYFMAKEMGLSTGGASLASIFMAVNLNVNILSRHVFAPNYVLLFGALFFWVLYRTVRNPHGTTQIFLLPVFAMAIQINLSHVSLALAILACFVFFRKRPLIQYQLIGALICGLLYLPYIIHLVQTDFQDIKDIIFNIESDFFMRTPRDAFKAILWPFIFSLPIPEWGVYMFPYVRNFYRPDIIRVIMLSLSFIFGIVVLLCPVIAFLKNGRKGFSWKNPTLPFLLISGASVIIVHLIRLSYCQAKYLYTIIPLVAILQAMGLDDLYHKSKAGIKRAAVCGLAAVFFITSVSEFFQHLSFFKNSMYGTLRNQLDAISYMQTESGNNYAIVSEMDSTRLNGIYMLAKYHYKILPRHPNGVVYFGYNDIKLPLPDDHTIKFYYHNDFPPNELAAEYGDSLPNKLPVEIVKQAVSVKQFGALRIFRLN